MPHDHFHDVLAIGVEVFHTVSTAAEHGEDGTYNLAVLSDFCCTFAMSLMILLVFKRSTKVSEKTDMTKSWAARLCRLPQQELFVAQELIKKVKLKRCGI